MDLAFRFEEDHKRFRESQPKGKGKMFAPRSSVSGVPSSNSFESSGKKRKERSSTFTSGRHCFVEKRC